MVTYTGWFLHPHMEIGERVERVRVRYVFVRVDDVVTVRMDKGIGGRCGVEPILQFKAVAHGIAGDTILMEERSDGILLRPARSAPAKLGWEETAAEMARDAEDWAAWDSVSADGQESVLWVPKAARVAEPSASHKARPGKHGRS